MLAALFALTLDAMSSALSQIIAALFTGLTLASLLGYMAKEWKQVRIVVI